MTWEPKNGLNDEDVDVSDEEEDIVNYKDDKNQHHTGTHHTMIQRVCDLE